LREESRLRVFENRVLRRIFVPKRDAVRGEYRKLHNELNDLYSSPRFVRVITTRRMNWARYVTHIGERRGVYIVLVGKPEGKNHLDYLGINGRIILICNLGELDGAWSEMIWFRIGTGGGHLRMR
jgi:hypothetical protein